MAVITPPKQTAKFSMASLATKGRGLPSRLIVHGTEGVGKTTIGAFAPKPVFVMTRGETGLETLMDAGQLPGIPHFPEAQSFQEVMAMLDAVLKDEHDYKTLVIDTMNGVERLCHEMVCEREYNGDWGKKGFTNFMCGFEVSLADIERFLMKLDAIREQRKMSIIGLCHTLVKSFKNPEGPDYDRYQAKMHDKTWNIIKAWADIVLFVNYDVTVDADAGSKKGKGYGGATRIMYTQRRASFDAKNRHGLPEEIEMGNSGREAWANFVNAMKKKG